MLPKLSIENYEKWLEWQAWQLDTPHWWEELTTIPDVEDIWRLAQKIWASFEVPSVRMGALEGQPFTMPPVLKCILRCKFLPDGFPCQEVRMKPHQMNLAYAGALQYWVEKVNLPVSGDPHPLARCVKELRWQVWRHMTCNEQDILDGSRDILLEDEGGKTPPVDSSAAMVIEDAQLSLVQTPLAENPTRPADEGEGKEQIYPHWIRVHSSQKVAAMGGVPSECGPTLLGGPSEPAPRDREDKGTDSVDALGGSKAPISQLESSLRMVISTSLGRCPSMGTVFMLMLTASMEVMNLEALSEVEGHQGPR